MTPTDSGKNPSAAGIFLAALAVAAGYYFGANLGLIMKLPPTTPSVMWPPNAILTAALLLAPPRRWPIYLLAAFPAHLAALLSFRVLSSFALVVFATNCSEALIGALIVRRLSDAPGRFDTLRRVGTFIVGAVVLGPFLSSFLDAAAVTTLLGEPYWAVWRTRFFANVLTELVLVPAVAIVATAAASWLGRASLATKVEAAVLAVVVILVGIVGFGSTEYGVIPDVPRSPLAILLPFLLWAAVRFGPGGASLSLLGTALVAIATVTHGPTTPTRDEVIGLQIFLSVLGIPLLCLAALIEERRRAQEALAERLRFEELLSRLSGAFVHLPSHEMDAAFAEWLRRLGEVLRLDRLMLLRVSADRQVASVAHSWTAPGAHPAPPAFTAPALTPETGWRWLLRDEALLAERSVAEAFGNGGRPSGRSDLVIPLVASGRVLGGLVFDALALSPRERDYLLPGLRVVAEVFAGALARKEAEDALRASEGLKTAILTSLRTGVAVLDREGRILAVNEAWNKFTHEDGATWDAGAGVGSNYLESCRAAALKGVAYAGEALAGIESVLERSRLAFAFDYAYGTPPAARWFAMAVVPLDRPEGGAVVSHTDVTERKRVEVEAQRSRQELAHFTRVSTMGELTASLAHELSQPLSGILTNAQAAQRFLARPAPDLREVRAILSDIVDDDKRAGEVIQRLRDLLRKSELARDPLDLNALIRDVAKLLASDAVIRNVAFGLELAPDPLVVHGDRVQLQQVILNLLLNAMDAMADSAGGSRTIVLRTERSDLDAVHVAVEDTGPGLARDVEQQIFEPFYTTKPSGMGMGLSIARSIVQAHGGLIWATNNPVRGATFHLALPLTERRV
ncbi:MAG TPA: MASE1 domain-containing protein [Methylomirabilota bacterium]|nr:MASE1 domain-containing protein [Methylomirabilota bacterium]